MIGSLVKLFPFYRRTNTIHETNMNEVKSVGPRPRLNPMLEKLCRAQDAAGIEDASCGTSCLCKIVHFQNTVWRHPPLRWGIEVYSVDSNEEGVSCLKAF